MNDQVPPLLSRPKTWTYGVTTVPARFKAELPRTLESLVKAGFTAPRLFIDGCDVNCLTEYRRKYPLLEISARYPTIRPFGNWALALAELYIREPHAERYAIFQDDIVAVANLRTYLDACEYPDESLAKPGYWNLCTYPHNHVLAPNKNGWFLSNQKGLGAQGLVFNHQAIMKLLKHERFVERPMDPNRGWRRIDGGVVHTMAAVGWSEYVHSPSLIDHLGVYSSMGNPRQPKISSFPGQHFDARILIGDEHAK